MARSERASILSWLRHMAVEAGGVSDAQLLDRFAANRDEAAFELLLRRHAQVVFEVCRRVLHDQHDAEDAFQATFLALARHAGRIARREAVAGWLHQVAYRSALTARGQRARRDAREKSGAAAKHLAVSPGAEAALENQELRHVVDEEIGRLPGRFRAAVVLCCLEGKSVDEAAMLLGCPRGTVASRLARARARLRVRLAGRGLAPMAALAVLSRANAAPRPFALIPALTATALRYAAPGAATTKVLAPRITALTEEVLRAMFLHKLKTGILVLIAFVAIPLAAGGLAVGLHAQAGPKGEPPGPAQAPEAQAAGKEKQAGDKPVPGVPHPVTVSRPTRGEAAPYREYTGRLEARRFGEVRPAVGGTVVKVCFKAGDEVKEGKVLFELDDRLAGLALQKAEAELALALAKKKGNDANLERATKLLETGTIPHEELDKIREQAATAEAAVKTANVEVARARLELDATRVRAPTSGQVGRSLVEPGAMVFHGQDRATLLTTVTALDPIGLTFAMDENSFLDYQRLLRDKQVKGAGSPLHMQLAGDKGAFPHEGTLESFDDRINVGTVRVRASFPNPDRLLLPGMFASVRMTFGPPRAVLEIPNVAIQSDQGMDYVLVVNDRNVAERRAVTLGQSDKDMRIIDKGLGTEDWVVIGDLRGIHAGDPVEPRKKARAGHAEPDRDRGR